MRCKIFHHILDIQLYKMADRRKSLKYTPVDSKDFQVNNAIFNYSHIDLIELSTHIPLGMYRSVKRSKIMQKRHPVRDRILVDGLHFRIETIDNRIVMNVLLYSSFCSQKRQSFPYSFQYLIDGFGIDLHQINCSIYRCGIINHSLFPCF